MKHIDRSTIITCMSSLRSLFLVHLPYSSSKATTRYASICTSPSAVPVIDMRELQGLSRSTIVSDIGKACHQKGYFQVTNHSIASSTLDGALDVATAFFDLATDEKLQLMSVDITRPVRYSLIKKVVTGQEQIQRLFLKQYAHPLEEWIHMWPSEPLETKMGSYSVEVRKVALQVMGAIVESLGLGHNYLKNQLHDGLQVMALHAYPPSASLYPACPSFGIAPHSDYSIITIALQNSPGLEELDPKTNKWELLPHQHSSLFVHVGNYLEAISNGLYKSAVHRVLSENRDNTRVSITSLHSLSMDQKVCVADNLVTEHTPKGYKESSLKDFLKFLSINQGFSLQGNAYIDMLKIK